MDAAASIALKTMEVEGSREATLRDRLIDGIRASIPDTRLNGHRTNRLPNNTNVSIEYIEGESMLLSLDMEGIAASTGSACTSSTLEPSHVLLAIGLAHEIAHGSLRFSIGRWTTDEQIGRLLEVLPGIVERLRAMSPLYSGRKKNGTIQR
jgi:cysteine desulfurase